MSTSFVYILCWLGQVNLSLLTDQSLLSGYKVPIHPINLGLVQQAKEASCPFPALPFHVLLDMISLSCCTPSGFKFKPKKMIIFSGAKFN